MARADAGLAEEDRSAGRLPLDENGAEADHRRGQQEAGQAAGEIQAALEHAVEETVDRQLFDPQDRHAAHGLQPQAGDEDLEH